MTEKNALTVSIGVLGAVAVWLTGALVLVPVWVVFIAWASFFILGGGRAGLLRSVLSNLTGIAIASLTLFVTQGLDLGLLLTGVAVGLGSALMVQASRVGLLAAIPAIVWGFASTVGTVAVTGRSIASPLIGNPVLIVVVAMVLGGFFGIVSEALARLMTSRRTPSAVTREDPA
jgi:hypothetical protein